MTLRVVAHRKIWYSISVALVVASVVALVGWGLKPGIDFTGGALMEIETVSAPAIADVRTSLAESGHEEAVVQQSGEHGFLIRTRSLTEDEHQALLTALRTKFGELQEVRFNSIGPVIGTELRRSAIMSVIVSLVIIGLYIAWAFRGTGDVISSKKTALLTLMKTAHDVLISVGVFAVLGHFFGYEADTAFVAAALTILGYSINDGVVVLDRTRENVKNRISPDFSVIVDKSIDQTLARSINTSVTVFLALLAVFLFGGETTRPFALMLMVGVAVGTYSSVFIASPLLVDFQKLEGKE